MTLRMGVLGCADIARRRLLPALAAAPDVSLVAVASRDAATAEATARPYGCRAVTGYAELLAMDGIDAVYVPLPNALHAPWAEAALRSGRHVLAEKPLTCAHADTTRLLDLARERSLVLMENMMFVHHRQHEAVRAAVADGAIGELRAVHAAFTIPERPDGDVRHRPELGGGALLDVGVYPLRAALHVLGTDLRVAGAHLGSGPGRTVDTTGAALLTTPGGVTAQLTFGMAHAYRSVYELWGSHGRLTVERAFTPPADARPVVRLETAGAVRELPAGGPHDQVAATVAAFARAVREGGVPDGQTAAVLRQAALLEEIRAAAGAEPGRPEAVATPDAD
ncbi:Gfo/Idh/MocA family oxidoreductase [Streptomyces sp. NPDC021096]|uniref:Gfo/Idh/MocA family protein n=1 Tax=Streptomyces sp. NPDC021096 TaxID=3154792 RepID=UPI0033ECB26E